MTKITDAGANNSNAVDGLRVPLKVTMLSLQTLDKNNVLQPNQALFDFLKSKSTGYDIGDGKGVQPALTLFNMSEIHHRMAVGTYVPGTIGSDGETAPEPRFQGDTFLERCGRLTDGTPTVRDTEKLWAWDEKATANGTTALAAPSGIPGAWVAATPKLIAQGIINAADEKPCEAAVLNGFTLPVVYGTSATTDDYLAGKWYKGVDGYIRKAQIDTNIDPERTSSTGYAAAWGTVKFLQTEWDKLLDDVYCSFFASLAYLGDKAGLPRDEFGKFNRTSFYEAIVDIVGNLESDGSIEKFGTSTHAETPEGAGAPKSLRISVKHDDTLAGAGNAVSQLRVVTENLNFANVPVCA